MFLGEFSYPAVRRVNPLQQIIEGEPLAHRYSNFSVENELVRLQPEKRLSQFREISGQRLA